MQSRDLNRFKMVISVRRYLETKKDELSAIPVIPGFNESLNEYIQGIRKNLGAAGKTTKGITISKNELRKQISNEVVILSGALSAYASNTKNNKLLGNGSIKKSDMVHLRDIEVPVRVEYLTDLLTPFLPALADYGVSEHQVTELTRSTEDYRKLIGLPRLMQSQINIAKKSAKKNLKDAMKLLNEKLDNVMLQFQTSNRSLYAGYLSARVIVDVGG